jgi:chaperone required for assembly of F1-ATPase
MSKRHQVCPSPPSIPLPCLHSTAHAASCLTEGYQIFLDSRPVRTPHKTILTIPPSKPHLAHAIALEWDLLTSAQQALKNHNIPLTSLTSRADDILHQETQQHAARTTRSRDDILKTVLRYLDTDTLLCWAPEKSPHDDLQPADDMPHGEAAAPRKSLRAIQKRIAQPILSYLTTRVWPGAELHPILDSTSIVPKKQPEMTKNIIRGWVAGLPAYELAALERGALASKSLLVATRLLVEWSEEFRDVQNSGRGGSGDGEKKFGIEEAAEACSTEVKWQTGLWGEVEDTHDVEKEDLRRQLGSVVLLVSGNR